MFIFGNINLVYVIRFKIWVYTLFYNIRSEKTSNTRDLSSIQNIFVK